MSRSYHYLTNRSYLSYLLLLFGFLQVYGTQNCRAQSPPSVCTDRIDFKIEGTSISLPFCYNFHPDSSNPQVERAVIVIHGSNRNAENQLEYINEAAELVLGALDSSLILAPQFLTEEDVANFGLDKSHPFWPNNGESWKQGYLSDSTEGHPRNIRVSSFTLIDSIIGKIMKKAPNLRKVIIIGHSGGGQFTNRYAAGNAIENQSPATVSFRYIITNPSTYLYFTPERPLDRLGEQFAIPSKRKMAKCPNYDRYKFGLSDFNGCEYMENIGALAIEQQFLDREVVLLLGEKDNSVFSSDLEKTCKANLQGRHRLERGLFYFNYLVYHFGPSVVKNHYLAKVPGVDHSARKMFISEQGINYLFKDILSETAPSKALQTQIRLFPNPSDQKDITLLTEPPFSGKLTLIDSSGKSIFATHLVGSAEHHLTDLNIRPGIYILKLEGASGYFTRKLVISR